MKNLFDQGAWRRVYVHTRTAGNAERAAFTEVLPERFLLLRGSDRPTVH